MDAIDSFMPYFLHLVVLYVSVVVIYLLYKYKSNGGGATPKPNLPPGRKGLPYIGETLDYVLASRWGTPEKFITDRTSKYSPDVFRNRCSEKTRPSFAARPKQILFPLSKKYTFAIACRLFTSVTDPDEIENFSKPFALATPGLISVPIDVPGTTFNRAVKAGRQIRQQLLALITKKKKEIIEKGKIEASDLVDSMLMDGMTEATRFLASSLPAMTPQALPSPSLSAVSRIIPTANGVLRGKEGGDEALRWEDIQKMKYTWCVACEVMRLAPPASGSLREAISDYTYAGYTIPKGWKIS
ncbi:Cytochrome P450 [Hibiscus syriacus]|uniref:Cytochrome P450 n=1 Tax=Hibiscus syriacus TaxID=106335 RepID=A0A6A2ZQ67_HIBSY|nr:Cytochrome P450 [Hibiscus syriacus]